MFSYQFQFALYDYINNMILDVNVKAADMAQRRVIDHISRRQSERSFSRVEGNRNCGMVNIGNGTDPTDGTVSKCYLPTSASDESCDIERTIFYFTCVLADSHVEDATHLVYS